jgi:hypothetical protein
VLQFSRWYLWKIELISAKKYYLSHVHTKTYFGIYFALDSNYGEIPCFINSKKHGGSPKLESRSTYLSKEL